jgi:hypothetical protein
MIGVERRKSGLVTRQQRAARILRVLLPSTREHARRCNFANAIAGHSCARDDRQDGREQNGEDGDNNEQFNERETREFGELA